MKIIFSTLIPIHLLNHRRLLFTAAVFLVMTGNVLASATFLKGLVPDWNQPYRYTGTNGPGPDPAPIAPNQWNDWCAPCSGADLAGYWFDVWGFPVADQTNYPYSSVQWAAGPSWQDYLADGTANRPVSLLGGFPAQTTDLGWYMDCNLGASYDANPLQQMGGFLFVPPEVPHSGTYLRNIHAGLQNFLNSRMSCYSFSGTNASIYWLTGTRGSTFAAGTDTSGYPATVHTNEGSAFGAVTNEINNRRPVIICFRHWVVNPTGLSLPSTGGTTNESYYGGSYYTWTNDYFVSPRMTNAEDEYWNFSTNGDALGHAVTAVGYIRAGDPDDHWQAAGLAGPTDWVIVHDNWASTPRNVIIPFDYGDNWVANVTAVPAITQAGFVKGLVPDWNQPYDYSPALVPPGPNGGPTYPNINNGGPFNINNSFVDQWSDWCGPSSAANLVGYWEDHHNVPVADNTAFDGSDVLWAAGPSWQDYLADGTANRPGVTNGPPPSPTDIGWYLDCNLGCPYDAGGGAMGGYDFANVPHPGTYIKDLHAGLKIYLNSRYGNSSLGWLTGTEGKSIAWGTNELGNSAVPFGLTNEAGAFGQVKEEISHDRPLLLSFKHWMIVPQAAGSLLSVGTNKESDFGGQFYTWGYYDSGQTNEAHESWNLQTNSTALGHNVTAVGYIPAGDILDVGTTHPELGLGPTDWVIVHDNWPSTPRNVIVPFDFANNWVANTIAYPATPPLYITNITLVDLSRLRVGFNGIPGTLHDLLGKSSLQTTNAWSVDVSNITFLPGLMWITNAIPPETTQRFFRVESHY